MTEPDCVLSDKDYAERWKAWIKVEIEENDFDSLEQCMWHLMHRTKGRINPAWVKELFAQK